MNFDGKIITGVDIVKIDRIDRILQERRESFINKIFTKKEIEYISKKNYRTNTIAGLFAAKEAISKAIGTGIGRVKWQDMEVNHDKNGKPYIVLDENVVKTYMIKDMSISISHEREYAIAFVVGKID